MDDHPTPVTLALDLLEAGLAREHIVERLQERFGCDRHDAIAAAATAGAMLQAARTRRRPRIVR